MWYARIPRPGEVEEHNVLTASVQSNDREFEGVELAEGQVHTAVRAADNQFMD